VIFADTHPERRKMERGTIRQFTTIYLQIALWKSGRVWHVRVHHLLLGYLGWGAFRYFGQAENYFDFLVEEWDMTTKFTQADRRFLRSCGIDSGHEQKRTQLDGTQQLLVECGLDPYNRTDYLLLAFAGNPPAELDGEIEAMLPEEFQTDFDEDEDEED